MARPREALTDAPSPPAPPPSLAWFIWGLGALLYLIGFFHRVAPAVLSDALMRDFAMGAGGLGHLSAFYFYSYVAVQIPTGIAADRWGPRRLLTLGAAVSAAGTVLFALAPSTAWAGAGRLLVGASVAVAFVSMMKLATRWFTPRQFTLATGLALMVGVLGAVFAGVPLRALVDLFGWRLVMGVVAGITAVLSLVIWLRVRDDPAQAGFPGHGGHEPRGERSGVWRDLREIASYRNIWLLLLAPVGTAGAVLTFAGLWGVPYLTQVRGLDPRQAAGVTSALLVAWALGGPTLGTWSERVGRRKPLYVATSAVAVVGWAVVVLIPSLPVKGVVALLLVVGFASGHVIIGFAFAKESVPVRLMGTASGVCNMGPLAGGMILQPVVGWMLDLGWTGVSRGGVRVYDAVAYQRGFAVMLAWVVVGAVLVCFTRETHCRQQA